MFIRSIQRYALVSILCLFVGAGVAGCNAEPGDTEANEEVGETKQALNCKAICAQIYKACIRDSEDPEFCLADRDACMEDCNTSSCEPSDPDCCQGQPTCW